MLVTEFVEQFNKLTAVGKLGGANNTKERDAFVADRIRRRYVPVAEKTGKLRVVLNSSVITPEGGVPYVDMMLNKILYYHTVIGLYTDLEATRDEKGKLDTLKFYDCLKESNALGVLLEAIGDDLTECLFVNEQVLNTWHLQNSSTRGFISNAIKDMSGLSEAFASKLEKVIGDLPTPEGTKDKQE